jgi:hypothetical protein
MRGHVDIRDYLFFQGDLGDYLRYRNKQATQFVDTIPEARFRSLADQEIIDEILQNFTISPIDLQEDGRTMRREETQIDVAHWRGEPGPIYVPGIRVTISIPFVGQPDLWRLRPSTFTTTFPRGRVRSIANANDVLEIVIQQPADQPTDQIKRQLDEITNDVRFYLENQRTDIERASPELAAQVQAAVSRRRQLLGKHENLSELLGIPEHPDPTTSEPSPVSILPPRAQPSRRRRLQRSARRTRWDAFLSHASEDKEVFARPLAEALQGRGISVWFDDMTLRVGDSLRRKIDEGLSQSRYGIVLISPAFLQKEWPQRELDGLTAREVDGEKVILPVWHNVDAPTLRNYSPTLADRIATNSAKGLEKVVDDLLLAIHGH